MPETCTSSPGAPCALFDRPALARGWRDFMVRRAEIEDGQHIDMEVWACRSCGQHWLWVFEEDDGWDDDSPMHQFLRPVASVPEGRAIAAHWSDVMIDGRMIYLTGPAPRWGKTPGAM